APDRDQPVLQTRERRAAHAQPSARRGGAPGAGADRGLRLARTALGDPGRARGAGRPAGGDRPPRRRPPRRPGHEGARAVSGCCAPSTPPGRGSATPGAGPTTPGHRPSRPPRPAGEGGPPRRRQVPVPGGIFVMGDHFDEGYPADGELPLHEVRLSPFRMDESAVTNAQFATFCKATGYVTDAEQLGVSPVFHLAVEASRSDVLHALDAAPWWLSVRGADWRHPAGPRSSITDLQNHPVVHVSWNDAGAYCDWADARLPTEAEWEYAARGGLSGARCPWGDELTPRGRWNLNVWQGRFPDHNTLDDGHLATAPVRSYRPNGYGLHEMVGNVWEWCHDVFDPAYYRSSPAKDPRGPRPTEDPSAERWRTMRGGSYLCHDSYCYRYRVAARSANTEQSATANLGFRCARDA